MAAACAAPHLGTGCGNRFQPGGRAGRRIHAALVVPVRDFRAAGLSCVASGRVRGTDTVRTDSFAPLGTPLSVRLGPNPGGRDLVVGDLHGHFATLRRALDELEVGRDDRLFSLGDLIDRGPRSFEAKAWIEGPGFHLVLRGNHEQLMLEALDEVGELPPGRLPGTDAWALWQMNGGNWWHFRNAEDSAERWMAVLRTLPFAARVETPHGPVGLVHACPVHPSWQELENALEGDAPASHLARTRAIWSRVYHGWLQREIGETGGEYLGPIEGVRAVLTGHTSCRQPTWHGNILGIDTGVHIDRPGYGRLTIARIDGKEVETFSFDR